MDMTATSPERIDAGPRWSATEVVVAAIAFTLATVAVVTRAQRPSSAPLGVAAAAFFTLLAGSYIAFSIAGVRLAVRATTERLAPVARLLAGPAILLVGIIAYALATGLPVLPRLATYSVYLFIPPLLLLLAPNRASDTRRAPIAELLVALALWLPIEFHLLARLPLPAPNGYDVRKLVALADGMYLFLIARPLPRIGYTYRLTWRDVRIAVVAFLVYACVALPIGFATGFIAWHPEANATRLLAPLVIYLATGVPEEFLFRGLIQNLLTQWLGVRAGLPVASVIFGLAHLPDPRYALLAAIAGVAYGWAYERTGKITASAVTHALVDGTWGGLLGG